MTDDLKQYGINIFEVQLVEGYYSSLRGIFLTTLDGLSSKNGYVLDLDSLPKQPIDFKGAFIRWLININLSRIKDGKAPVITLELALKCPLWKFIKPPLVRMKLTPEGMFNKPKVKTAFQKASPKRINK